jgi:hypothetical protein
MQMSQHSELASTAWFKFKSSQISDSRSANEAYQLADSAHLRIQGLENRVKNLEKAVRDLGVVGLGQIDGTK